MQSRLPTVEQDDTAALVLSNSTDATADYLCYRFDEAGVAYRRFNTDSPLIAVRIRYSASALQLEWAEGILCPSKVRAVIFRRPQPVDPPIRGDAYQRQHAADEWAEALEGFLAHIPLHKWINHPSSNFGASHKVHQLVTARACGLRVPSWLVTTDPRAAHEFLSEFGPKIIAKPLSGGYIERQRPEDDTLIYTQLIGQSHSGLFDRLPACPVLFQQQIEKRVDVRIIVVDHSMVAAALSSNDSDGKQRLDIRRDNMRDVHYAPIPVPATVAKSIRALMAQYRLRFSAMDFAIDTDGRWIFFEVNPNGQWAWLDLAGACDAGSLFVDAMKSASEC